MVRARWGVALATLAVACGATCGVGGVDPCGLPPEAGLCTAAFPRYAFNPATAQCEQFIYGGCDGNENNFETQDACQKACEHRADVCVLCDKAGTCTNHDCAACPETADCSGQLCETVGLACTFLPACGAVTCTCKDDTGEAPFRECIPNTC